MTTQPPDTAREELGFILSYLAHNDQNANHAWMVRRIRAVLAGKEPGNVEPWSQLDGVPQPKGFAVGDQVKERTGDPTMFGRPGKVLKTRDIQEILVDLGPLNTTWQRAEHFAPRQKEVVVPSRDEQAQLLGYKDANHADNLHYLTTGRHPDFETVIYPFGRVPSKEAPSPSQEPCGACGEAVAPRAYFYGSPRSACVEGAPCIARQKQGHGFIQVPRVPHAQAQGSSDLGHGPGSEVVEPLRHTVNGVMAVTIPVEEYEKLKAGDKVSAPEWGEGRVSVRMLRQAALCAHKVLSVFEDKTASELSRKMAMTDLQLVLRTLKEEAAVRVSDAVETTQCFCNAQEEADGHLGTCPARRKT